MCVLDFFFLPRVENIDSLAAPGCIEGAGGIFSCTGDARNTPQNEAGIVELGNLEAPLSSPCNKLPFLSRKKTTRGSSQSDLYASGAIYILEFFALSGKGCAVWSDNGNIDFKIFEFWLQRANRERKLPSLRTTTTVLLHKRARARPLHTARINTAHSATLLARVSAPLFKNKD